MLQKIGMYDIHTRVSADLITACGRRINAAKELGPSRQMLRAVLSFIGLVHLTDWGFDFQLVPPDMMSKVLKRGDPKMGGLTKVIWATRPEQLLKVEAGPISIIMGANLRKPVKDAGKQITDKTQSAVGRNPEEAGRSTDD